MRFSRKSRITESPREEKTMMRLIGTTSVASLAIAGSFVLASPAFADNGTTTCNTTNDGVTNCLTQGTISTALGADEVSASAHAYARTKSGAHILVAEWEVSKAQMRKAAKNGDCRWFKVVWNSGFKNGTGKMGWHKDYHVYGCLVNGKWYKYGGGVTGLACGNLLRLISSPPPAREIVKGKVKWSAHNVWTVHVHMTSHSTGTEYVESQSSNSDNTCFAHAAAYVHGYASASSGASATASNKVRAKASAEAKIKSSLHTQVSGYATANTKTAVQTWAMTQTSCTPSQPSQTPSPAVISIEQPNDVAPNEQRPVCAKVSIPGTDTGTVTFSANLGTFPNSTVTGVSGQAQQVCETYVAPGETGNDTITVFVQDDQTGLHAEKSTDPFPVQSPPPTP